uniref:Uncharacterized protein n=1 Tax=Avena sativa TaxID=4498 RepID=A0ACD5W4Q3_AVESA
MQSKFPGMSPLSELVWSPDDGLSIKIAASSLSTRKASLRWNADTLNIVISSPQPSGGAGGKSGDNVDATTLRDAGEMPSQLRTRSDTSVRVSMASPNRTRNFAAQQSTSITSQEQDSKCCGGINLMNEGKELSVNRCADKPDKEEVRNSPTRCCKDASHSVASKNSALHSISEKQVTVHNGRSWADNTWRARLVKAISQRDYVLPNNALNAQSPIGNTRKVPGKLSGFIDNKSDNHQDQVMQGNHNNDHQDQVMQENHGDNSQDQVKLEHHKDEPILARCESTSGVNAVSKCDSASGVNPVTRYESTDVNPTKLEKGKEKVMHDRGNCVSNTKQGDDSNESMESCPSMKAPKREHAQYSTCEMSSRNKRCRREYNESSCSGLLPRNGSSFFNWMSSLTNGSTVLERSTTVVSLDQKCSEATGNELAEHSVELQKNIRIPLQSVGFNSLFQSLYCRNVMTASRDTCHQSEMDCTEREADIPVLDLNGSDSMLGKKIGMGKGTLDVAIQDLAADSLQEDSGSGKGNFRDQIGVFPLGAGRNFKMPSSSKSCSRTLVEKKNECYASSLNAATGNKGGFTESLWVSRLLPKTSMKLMDATPCNVNGDFCAVSPKGAGDRLHPSSQQKFNVEKEFQNSQYFTSTGSDNGTTSSKCPVIPQEEHKQSETMASILAKRLDALRHAKTSAVRLAISCDHEISEEHNQRKSPFVINHSSHDGLEAGQETQKSSSGHGRLVLWLGDKGKEQLCPGSDEESRGNMLSRGEDQHCGGSIAGKAVAHDNLEANTSAEYIGRRGLKIKEVGSDSMDSLRHNKQIVPYGIIPSGVCDQSSIVFGSLQRLRLSRSDIIRWLMSPIMHTTLDGFFLRLRFGKLEEALGGTGYHVARINGALDRNRLSVTIRNSTCQVDSRFVSNHEFHEDELKAWWSAAMKGGWKLPSKEELSKKLRERELLRSQNATNQHGNT